MNPGSNFGDWTLALVATLSNPPMPLAMRLEFEG